MGEERLTSDERKLATREELQSTLSVVAAVAAGH